MIHLCCAQGQRQGGTGGEKGARPNPCQPNNPLYLSLVMSAYELKVIEVFSLAIRLFKKFIFIRLSNMDSTYLRQIVS